MNRLVVQAAKRRASDLAARQGVAITFSITTNGTLLTEADADFFEANGFAVTVSLDGPRDAHDALRPYRNGSGSFDVIMRRLAPLLARQGRMQVSARVTVTPANLGLRCTLDDFVAAGFHSVGFAPMLASPGAQGEMQAGDLEAMLGELIDCGREYERRVLAGERYPFANLDNALRELHRGTHRPYPCGAGAGYLGISADGEIAACHRFVGDQEGAMGSLASASTASDRPSGFPHATSMSRSPVDRAGRATCVVAAAITRSSGAAGPPATTFVAGCTTASRRICACRRRTQPPSAANQPGAVVSTVCVVGGGPAGSTFAARMAQLGHDVVLVEQAVFPRRRSASCSVLASCHCST